ncbi:MAG: hypothetical protein MK135_09925 [Polyangiaceae bacterium]|nr:hypothetical protein [Polyangiaceae bacterium]
MWSALTLALFWSRGASAEGGAIVGQPWLKDRKVAGGDGLSTKNLVFHPSVSGEFGFDSNYYQRSGTAVDDNNFGPVVPMLRFRVTPSISMESKPLPAPAEGALNQPLPRLVQYGASANLTYNEFISLDSEFRAEVSSLRRLMGGASAYLNLFERRTWAVNGSLTYQYIAEPSNQPGAGAAFDRSLIIGGANLVWTPGGGSFSWTLIDVATDFTLFARPSFNSYNRGNYAFTTRGRWNFLPKTALIFDGSVGAVSYSESVKNNGRTSEARVGLSGLLTNRLSATVIAGWAVGNFTGSNAPVDYNNLVGAAQLEYFFKSSEQKKKSDGHDVGVSSLTGGYQRSFAPSFLGDFFRRDRGYLRGKYMAGGRFLTTLEAGVAGVAYPDYVSAGVPGVNDGFTEYRLDLQAFGEYRPLSSLGVNLTLRYDQNISQVVQGIDFEDDLSFKRFKAFLGVRWFM